MPRINQTINRVLRNDAKLNSYKIALVRAINDVVLSYPDLDNLEQPVAIPLRALAELWVAYYWPFVDVNQPVLQGPRAYRDNVLRNDISFRPELSSLRQTWEAMGISSQASDGFYLVGEMRVPRRRSTYPATVLANYDAAVRAIIKAIAYPIRYAGEGGAQYQVFEPPAALQAMGDVATLPGTLPTERCVPVSKEMWREFAELSLWVEALCIHEWSLFSEALGTSRGVVYGFLTARPDNRRPLTWERNEIDLLMLEEKKFYCPWTGKLLSRGTYDIDHIIPLAVLPFNDLWNLVPADSHFNSHIKRAKLPSREKLEKAIPHLVTTYALYKLSKGLAPALCEDATLRFTALPSSCDPRDIAQAVSHLADNVANMRNLSRF